MSHSTELSGSEEGCSSKGGGTRGKSWRREREERGCRRQTPPAGGQEDEEEEEESAGGGNVGGQSNDLTELHHDVERAVEDASEGYVCSDGLASGVGSSDLASLEEAMHEEEEARLQQEEDKKLLATFIAETEERLRSKAELRAANQNAAANRPEEAFFSKLDSSLKRNTAFVKRLRNITEVQRDSLIKDMNSLNLTKYISEAAAAIVDAKIKMSDVGTAVQISSLLHQRYADFSPQLLENWQKALPTKKDDKITNPSKIRVDLRFYAELITCGVFALREGLPMLGNLLTLLTASDKEEHHNLNILLSFCRHCGEDYAGLLPRKMRILADRYCLQDVPKSDFLMPDRQKGLRNLLKEYFKSLCRHLVKDHKALQTMDRQNRRTLQTKGELGVDRKEKFETAQVAFHKLLSCTQQFADILDEDVPDLPMDELITPEQDNTNIDVHNRFRDEADGGISLWEDEDTRSFYENLPDLKSSIPGILFKDSVQPIPEQALEEEFSKLEMDEMDSVEDVGEVKPPESENHKVSEVEEDLTEVLLQEIEDPEEDGNTSVNTNNKILLDGFLSSLLNCVNREMIDQAAVDFCMNLNTKPNRKKLVRSLFLVPRTRLDLLPFYARFVAILFPCMADVANELVAMLKQDFKFHIKKKDQINIESKIKTVRFIGELVKFGLFPKSEALYCLKMLLFDFSHHHIEMACNLLETCGRYLFRSADSHQRTKVYLDQMMRKKSVMAIDSRYTTTIENAFYYCNPPEAPATVRVERPPLHNYIRRLLYKDLTKNNTEKILRQMRKLNWEDDEVAAYATKCLISIWNVKFYNIRCMANLLAGLVAYQENVGPQVVDGVLEDIRLGMEVNLPKYNQRRVSMVRYLGELYNYRMVESSVIFRIIYSFITFGVNYDGIYSDLDPPESLFRIRLVCMLLETCGQYFNSGSSKRKLDCFLVFFQRYYWHKKTMDLYDEDFPFPVTVDFMVKDTLAALRPKLKLCDSQEMAVERVESLLEELKPRLAEIIPSLVHTEDEDRSQTEAGGAASAPCLGPIQEVEDEDDDLESSEDERDVFSGSQSQPNEEDLDHLDNEEGTISDDDGTRGPSQEVTLLGSTSRHVQCQEDEDFMTAFDKILSESIMHRTQEPVKPQVDIVIPMNIKGGILKKTVPIPEPEPEPESTNTINFILMTRKGNKQQFKNLEVPVASELAQNLKDREEAERMEKEHVKKLTLDINERQEEEDYQEMLAAQQRPVVMNLNRDRRHKYQHPKGAPDADLIFGNKCVHVNR